MAVVIAPGDVACIEALRLFVAEYFPDAPAYRTKINRVPEPSSPNFAMITLLRQSRLATNVHGFADCEFTASIAPAAPPDTGIMTVTAVRIGALAPGATVFGADVAAGSTIVSGPPGGGAGSYVVSVAQTLAARTLACGAQDVTQKVQLAAQVDFYGPKAADYSAAFSTLFRDEIATEFFGRLAPGIVPLHADEPRQIDFITEEQQYQDRWTLEADLDVDVVVTLPQQFAAALETEIVNVDAIYPP